MFSHIRVDSLSALLILTSEACMILSEDSESDTATAFKLLHQTIMMRTRIQVVSFKLMISVSTRYCCNTSSNFTFNLNLKFGCRVRVHCGHWHWQNLIVSLNFKLKTMVRGCVLRIAGLTLETLSARHTKVQVWLVGPLASTRHVAEWQPASLNEPE